LPLFFCAAAALIAASCRQGDDVVANPELSSEIDASIPDVASPPDISTPIVDVASEPEAPPITIDHEEPPPPIDVTIDVGLPPVDSSVACDPIGPTLTVARVNSAVRTEACAGQVAAHAFTHALCTCDSINASLITTFSIDSSSADKTSIFAGAPVGTGGNDLPAAAGIGGSLTIAGTAGPVAAPYGIDVRGDLRMAPGGSFTQLNVRRNAWFMSSVAYLGSFNVLGSLYLGPTTPTPRGIGSYVAPDPIRQSFTVSDPCECAERLDVAAIETAGAARADNALHGFSSATLVNVNAPRPRVDLPCGRIRLDSIGGTPGGSVEVRVTGRTALFVDGNVDLSSFDFSLVLDPGAELDWFILGNLVFGSARIGDPERPSATRIYVHGSADIAFPAGGLVGANLYAPTAVVNIASSNAFVLGSIYAKTLNAQSGVTIRYDRAILNQGNKCGQPATCDKCHSCNSGAACIGTTCGACRDDSDCCAPLVCDKTAGTCGPLLLR
jgi:hypothetical protein